VDDGSVGAAVHNGARDGLASNGGDRRTVLDQPVLAQPVCEGQLPSAVEHVAIAVRAPVVPLQITLRDVNELFDVRLSLEILAARLAAQAAARGQSSSRLQQMMDQAEEATLRHDHAQIPLSNTALHAEIVAMGGNSLLEYSMKPLLGRMQWLFTLTGHRDPQVQCAEHLSLCKAIYDGKADLAAALAFAHVELGREPSLQGLAGRLPES
jgi:DNA-binding GntR family transcriptional regulator